MQTSARGQALLELAVFGTIALAALGFLIRVGLKMNYDQEVRMMAFRRALAAASADNGTDQDAMGVTMHYVTHRQMPDATNGYFNAGRERSEASAFVEWGERLTFAHEIDTNGDGYADSPFGSKTQPLTIVRSDDQEGEFRQDEFPDDEFNGQEFKIATRGVVKTARVLNDTQSTIAQNPAGSTANGSVTTNATTEVQTKSGGSVSSTLGSGTFVNWPQ